MNNNPPCCECCKLLCNTTKECLCMAGFTLNKVIDFCQLGERYCNDRKKLKIKNRDNDIEEDEKNQKQYCYCCEFSDYKKEEYKKNKEFFCYC